ncbi:hypothetical protein AAU61_09965 [Desulfocarbo indianensis]|nr:hypothetical protein AAU61_09965 [Desulfocarbo indianensis]
MADRFPFMLEMSQASAFRFIDFTASRAIIWLRAPLTAGADSRLILAASPRDSSGAFYQAFPGRLNDILCL